MFRKFPTPRATTRLYHGSGQIVQNDSLVMTRFPGGFLDGNGQARYYMTDYQGNNIAVIDSEVTVIDRMGYYPYGLPWDIPASTDFLFADKEYQHLSGLDEYIHGARRSMPYACAFSTPDALCEKRPWESPYLFCGANPVRYIDPSGEAWRMTYNDENKPIGWEEVPDKDSYDKNGKLLPGLYEQAILFDRSAGKEFNEKEGNNIGSTVATVYKDDGTTEEFEACTYPSDTKKFATVPEGAYEAKVGKHKLSSPNGYTALRMSDVGTKDFTNNSIELGAPNPSDENTTKAVGINIHKAGRNNYTGMLNINTKNDHGVSEGFILINIRQWDSFISIFTKTRQKRNVVGIIIKK